MYYHPYQPSPSGGSSLFIKSSGHDIVWKADDLFDAGDTIVANAARHYSGEHVHIEGPADDPAAILGSPQPLWPIQPPAPPSGTLLSDDFEASCLKLFCDTVRYNARMTRNEGRGCNDYLTYEE